MVSASAKSLPSVEPTLPTILTYLPRYLEVSPSFPSRPKLTSATVLLPIHRMAHGPAI